MTKKSVRKERSKRPAGHSPVIAVRVSKPLYNEIKDAAGQAQQTMSDHMAWLLGSALAWQRAYGEIKRLQAEAGRLMKDDLKAEMRRQGWKPVHGSPYWLIPGAAPKDGFKPTGPDPVEAALDGIERCLAVLRATRPEGARHEDTNIKRHHSI